MECGMRKEEMRNVGCGNVECEMWRAKREKWDVECDGIWNVKSEMQHVECGKLPKNYARKKNTHTHKYHRQRRHTNLLFPVQSSMRRHISY